MPICPRCHQPIRDERCGVYLPPRKSRIIGVLEEAGEDGISIDKFIAAVWDEPRSQNTVKSHITQLNRLLASTDYEVRFDREARRIYLTRERKKVA
jgi:DNA-binding winged helix-turn-helix (wHTH) protein